MMWINANDSMGSIAAILVSIDHDFDEYRQQEIQKTKNLENKSFLFFSFCSTLFRGAEI